MLHACQAGGAAASTQCRPHLQGSGVGGVDVQRNRPAAPLGSHLLGLQPRVRTRSSMLRRPPPARQLASACMVPGVPAEPAVLCLPCCACRADPAPTHLPNQQRANAAAPRAGRHRQVAQVSDAWAGDVPTTQAGPPRARQHTAAPHAVAQGPGQPRKGSTHQPAPGPACCFNPYNPCCTGASSDADKVRAGNVAGWARSPATLCHT